MINVTQTAPNGSLLWRIDEVENAVAPAVARARLPGWVGQAYMEFREKLLDPAFPCTFGTVAQRRGEIRFAFVTPLDAMAEHPAVRDALIEFTDLIRPLDSVTASLRPFAVFLPAGPELATVHDYFIRGWALLRFLHENDPVPRPKRVPLDPDDPRWSFCFAGLPLFVTFKTPAHLQRRSRRMAGAFLVLFQARDGFDILAGDSEHGRNVRAAIRRRLAAYDDVPVSSALDHYGVSGNREWSQYFAPEDSKPLAVRCPFHTPAKDSE
jgi:FPC/CPF motif-containing protein YcgG